MAAELQPGARSESLRLPVKVRRLQKQNPPWHDEWAITMDDSSLLQLSAELLSLPGPLTPRLDQISRLLEDVISHGLGENEGHSAAWEHGLHSATLREMCDDG